MKSLLQFFCFLLLSIAIQAQAFEIQGTVADSLTRSALYPANVVLRDASTQVYLRGTITNEAGQFQFSNTAPGRYLLTVSYLGYRNKEIEVIIENKKQTNIGTIFLAVAPVQIGEVEIIFKPVVHYGEDSDVTLNLDMLGDLGEQSVFDVINSLVGLNVDFDDKIRYNGYTDFTTLIDGQKMGANFMRISINGDFESFILKRIPAKYIKTVEIIPEPKGRFGFYTPVINLIPKGNLRDFYTAFSEVGIEDKYGLGFGVSKVYQKLTLTPELAYKHPAVFSEEDEDRENHAIPANSYSRNSNTKNWGIDKRAALLAEYRFENTHVLRFSAEENFTENKSDITRNTNYTDGKNDRTNDSRYSDAPRQRYTMSYRRGFYIGERRSLRMNMNASINKNSEETNQDITDIDGISSTQKYRSSSKKDSKKADLKLNYFNTRHRFQYLFDVGFSWDESDENSSREFFNHSSDNWEELSPFLSDRSFSRLSSDMSLKIRRKIEKKKSDKTVFHSFEASISENLNMESITDNLNEITSDEKNARTSFGLSYRGILSEYGSLVFNYNGRLSRPTAEQLLETPVYIDNYTIRTGNAELSPEMVNTLTADYTWNDANVMRFSKNTIIPPRFGYSLRAMYSASSNKIEQSHSINDDGILTYSYRNSSGTKMLTVNSDFYTRISTFMNFKIGADYKYETYADNAESIRSGNSWTGNSSFDIRILKKLKLEAKYKYNSSRIFYQRKIHGYHEGSISMSAPAWKNNIYLTLEASNLLSHSGIKTDYYGESFSYKTIKYPEYPIIWFRASLMFFKFK